jgi:integrase/recombinase XerD
MAGRQAKILSEGQLLAALRSTRNTRYPIRDKVMLLLSAKAGLRAAEIAGLTWPMLTTADGEIGDYIALANSIAKKGSGRAIPLHPRLKSALSQLAKVTGKEGHVIKSERSEKLSPGSVVNWFKAFYRRLGFEGCSSHSGRRTFITLAARRISKAGGSIRDVQMLAGHRSLRHTQGYIEANTQAQRRLMNLL